ncbi:transcriptional regulator, TetR family [Cohaesibacter sp. ES.047]|uniref:TetR/AcrR family transcriptional regulator n=1 Tax=Cohaesibacter sp. ES.047 TaxID=1798205 RepID=UPI000BB841A7|nr:TetR/AcrR family transcriptional regulator [Cohaesibacter sp. ES.047]SNY92140.1 transcriptional regulator, TetR family [Cohaesibacter sp. ES.047]
MRVKTDEKRQEIVAVATKIFGEMGYHEASMSAISAALGGSKATLYGYFKSKEQLFAAVLTDALEEYGSQVFDALETRHDADLKTVLHEFGHAYLTFVTTPEVMSLGQNAMTQKFSEDLGPELYKNGSQKGWRRVEHFMTAKLDEGALSAPSALVASLQLKGLLESGILEPLRYGCEPHVTFDEAVDYAVAAFLGAYGAQPAS